MRDEDDATRLSAAMEGIARETSYLVRGRNAALRAAALGTSDGRCQACGIRYRELLGGLGRSALHVHHKQQLSLRELPSVTVLGDLAVVCASCHAMIHADPTKALPVEKLRSLLKSEALT